jgi:DNA replication licensing factor MCM5
MSRCLNSFAQRIPAKTPMAGAQLPKKCDRDGGPGEDCGPGSFVVMADNCEFFDQQTLKLQESPEVVPTGEMPRNIMLTVDRSDL